MSIIACAGPDAEGANWTPHTLGEYQKNEKAKLVRLREARAGAQVIREARLFHERQAQKHGLSTRRGIAHLRAARMFSREAGASLQERLESFNGEIGQIDPKVLAKTTKDTINFHQKMAKKAGLDTPEGHAHTAAMEHHMDTLNKLQQGAGQKQPKQPPQQVSGEEAAEGGPGSGPHGKSGLGRPFDKKMSRHRALVRAHGKALDKLNSLRDKYPNSHPAVQRAEKARNKIISAIRENLRSHQKGEEALPGKSGKQLPVPVPKKSQMPNNDIKMNKPPINLDAQQGGGQRLQQGQNCVASSEGGPGSGPRKGSGGSKGFLSTTVSNKDVDYAMSKTPYSKWKDLVSRKDYDAAVARARGKKKESRHSFESRLRRFSREAGERGPNDGMACTLPDDDPLAQISDKDKVYRGKQPPLAKESRRYLRRAR